MTNSADAAGTAGGRLVGVDLDRPETFAHLDPGAMLSLVMETPEQGLIGRERADAARLPSPLPAVRHLVASGMGGSAISAEIVAAIYRDRLTVPCTVVRDYHLPGFVGPDTLVVCQSFSGNTEETLSIFQEALSRGASVVAITTGGKLADLATQHGASLVLIPNGRPPRSAIGFLFAAMLRTLERWGLVPADSAGVAEAEGLLASQRDRFRPESPTAQNPAKELARALCGRLPFIFGSNAAMGVVATRWRTQLNENSKVLAASQVFPELNHNEIVGWEMAGGTVAHPVVVLLRSRADSARLQQRVEFTKKLLALRAPVHEVWGEGESPLAQTLTAMYLGDVTSVYLALLQETDPTTITPIIELKRFLAEQPDTA